MDNIKDTVKLIAAYTIVGATVLSIAVAMIGSFFEATPTELRVIGAIALVACWVTCLGWGIAYLDKHKKRKQYPLKESKHSKLLKALHSMPMSNSKEK